MTPISRPPRKISAFRPANPNFLHVQSIHTANIIISGTRVVLTSLSVGADRLASHDWSRMKATGRPILSPTRNFLLNLLVEEPARTLARRPLCRKCLHTLRSNDAHSQKIARISGTCTPTNGAVSSCAFWHAETRRRRPAVSQLRSLATVREGPFFQLLQNSSMWTLDTVKDPLMHVAVPKSSGPLEEYDERVHSRRLRDDEHQRCAVVLPEGEVIH